MEKTSEKMFIRLSWFGVIIEGVVSRWRCRLEEEDTQRHRGSLDLFILWKQKQLISHVINEEMNMFRADSEKLLLSSIYIYCFQKKIKTSSCETEGFMEFCCFHQPLHNMTPRSQPAVLHSQLVLQFYLFCEFNQKALYFVTVVNTDV